MKGHDLTSRTIARKSIHDIRGEIPAYVDPFYRPTPKPKNTYKGNSKEILDSGHISKNHKNFWLTKTSFHPLLRISSGLMAT